MTTPRRLGLATLFVVALMAVWAWGQSGSLTEEEEPFAGSWRQEVPTYTESGQTLALDVELRRNGTARFSVSGAAVRELPDRAWRVVDGHFQYYTSKGRRNVINSDYEVAWETPDRVRLLNPSTKTSAIIWRRR